jgi:hypothetical protein
MTKHFLAWGRNGLIFAPQKTVLQQLDVIEMKNILVLFAVAITFSLGAQTGGTVRGNIFDKESGEPIIYGNVILQGTTMGVNTDFNGFFTLGNVPPGDYKLVATYIGYDSVVVDVKVKAGGIIYERLYMSPSSVVLDEINVSASKEQSRSDVQISKVTVTPKEIRALPSTGGESDIAQYLPVLPGIVVSGDQGGQLYIRGGSPVQNKILLDGMTIYNPFHSIGFFSVFETESIRSVDVLTGGFNAEYGGRVSAVVDIKTREGNKKRFGGLVSASPFQVKGLFEGPIKKLSETGGGSTSFLLTGKHSYLDQSSKIFYGYATDTTFFSFASGDTSLAKVADEIGLPYSYTDLYGKVSFLSENGSKLNIFGFNFTDRFNFLGLVNLNWQTVGAGSDFTLIPPNSNVIINGAIALSDYDIILEESDGNPRRSGINSFNANLNFTYFGNKTQVNYGFEFTGFNTDFSFTNLVGLNFSQRDFTTELAGYLKYKQQIGDLILEPGIRLHYYASQSEMSVEPRFGLKYNISDNLRIKAAGGFYSQNLISTVNELDVVNFFVGFLAGPEQTFFKPGGRDPVNHRLQKSIHGVAGLEIDVTNNIQVNIEPYFKRFTQLIAVNRNKLQGRDPDFITETGNAYGIDFSMRYENRKNLYLWMTYSYAFVDRDDGEQVYPTVFDRRHNVNLLATYASEKTRTGKPAPAGISARAFPSRKPRAFIKASCSTNCSSRIS